MTAEERAEPTGLERSLPQSAYISDVAFTRERERIFFREWFCAGRVEEVTAPGDFLLANVAGERVLVVRTRAGLLAGFYDVCRHRGCRLALDFDPGPGPNPGPTGRFGAGIRCPYHSWTYGLDGGLLAAPFLDGELPDYALHPVGVDSWGGFLFVHLTPDDAGDSLAGQLGPIPERLRRYPLGDLRVGRRIVYEVGANWKVIAENYNECYHCGPVHPELCRLVPSFKSAGGGDLDWEEGIPHREGAYTFTGTGTTTRAPFPGLSDEERTRHKGELVYPNLLLSLSADHVAALTLWPRAPGRTTIVFDLLFHPSEIESSDFDPSDAADFWDLINRQDWRVCEGVQDGMTSRVFRHGLFAPMEDPSLDIREYVRSRLGEMEPD